MKKLAAIFLFTIFLLNFIGYRVVFLCVQKQSDLKIEALLDKNIYEESELITLKVPFSLPYQPCQTEFERVDGEVTFNGKIYKYVKRRIDQGALILLCLPDYNKMRLKKEKEDYYKGSNDIAQDANSKKQENSKGNSYKNVLSEYDQLHYKVLTVLFEERISHSSANHKVSLAAAPHSSPEQPPELL